MNNKNYGKHLFPMLSVAGLTFMLVMTLVVLASAGPATAETSGISGRLFIDFDRDGQIDPGEHAVVETQHLPVEQISVTATDEEDTVALTQILPDQFGHFELDTGVLAGTHIRVEFALSDTDLAAGWSITVLGPDSASATQVVTAGSVTNLGLVPPSRCPEGDEGTIWATCFVSGSRAADGPSDVVSSLRADLGGEIATVGTKQQLGSVWGLAYNEWRTTLFASAVLKRQTDLGDYGLAGLYWTDPTRPDGAWSGIDLHELGGPSFGDLQTLGLEPRDLARDDRTIELAAKVGIGDIDLTPDGQTLLVTNLAARSVMVYDVSALADGEIRFLRSIEIANPDCPDRDHPDDYQIWGLATIDANSAYVGAVCTSEHSAVADADTQFFPNLAARLLEVAIAPAVPDAVQAEPSQSAEIRLRFPLNYRRGCANGGVIACRDGRFNAWTDTYPREYFVEGRPKYNQPVFSDIEVHRDGSLSLGFLDRFGYQASWGGLNDPTTDERTEIEIAGEVLRVCRVVGELVVEGLPGCDPTTNFPDGANGHHRSDDFHAGPYALAEWYGADALRGHTETSNGGLYLDSFTDQLYVSAMSPESIYSGGIERFDGRSGAVTAERNLYTSTAAPYEGKGAGIGDLAGCALPVEVGGRVWIDADGDGIFDPSESPMAGVRVQATGPGLPVDGIIAMTSANGLWSLNTADGLSPGTTYEVIFSAAEFGLTDAGPLSITTGTPGSIDHTFNAGFIPRTNGIATSGIGTVEPDGTPAEHDVVLGCVGRVWRLADELPDGHSDILASNGTQSLTFDIAALEAGRYSIRGVSFDGYASRGDQEPQLSERWYVEFLSADGSVLATTTPTDDLSDDVDAAIWAGSLGEIDIAERAVKLNVVHLTPGNAVNSVQPVCIGVMQPSALSAAEFGLTAEPLTS